MKDFEKALRSGLEITIKHDSMGEDGCLLIATIGKGEHREIIPYDMISIIADRFEPIGNLTLRTIKQYEKS